jgi:hypothetical protein
VAVILSAIPAKNSRLFMLFMVFPYTDCHPLLLIWTDVFMKLSGNARP